MNTPLTNTTKQMKQKNIVLVTETLKSLVSATKAEIAAHTGLSLPTCGTILNDLCAQEEVLEESLEESRGGRPAQRYTYNQDYFNVLSIYAEGSKECAVIAYSVRSATGKMIEEGSDSFQAITVENFVDYIQQRINTHPNIQVIGVGLPGVVVNGHVFSCDLSVFEGVSITERLQEKFGVFVQAGNDMNYTAFGFYRNNCRNEQAPVAYIYMPEGHCAGCGIVIAGKMLRGATQFAGEVSKLPFYKDIDENTREIDPETDVINKLNNVIASLIAVINPVTIALSGDAIKKETFAAVKSYLQQNFHQDHLPTFVLRDNIDADYHYGITEYTLDAFNKYRIFGHVDQ
jgi:hypothetical protein